MNRNTHPAQAHVIGHGGIYLGQLKDLVAHGLVAICPNSATAGRALVPWRDTHAFATLGFGGARRCLQAGAGCGPGRVACVQVDPLRQDIKSCSGCWNSSWLAATALGSAAGCLIGGRWRSRATNRVKSSAASCGVNKVGLGEVNRYHAEINWPGNVIRRWPQSFSACGMSPKDIDHISPAFLPEYLFYESQPEA